MATPILATKLYIPPPRPGAVPRPRLLERLNEGLRQDQGFARKLTLISAPAGFGKTALMGQWVAGFEQNQPKTRVAWLSLEEADGDPARFLTYLIAALQTVAANIGEGILAVLQSPQPPPIESMLTPLLNGIAAIPHTFVLVLDDYHVIDAKQGDASTSVDDALAFLLEHLPPRMHLVIVTREDPHLPLARLRARGQLTELRAADLRFTPAEVAEFLNQVMGLNLSAENVAALETRTEGWIAGLQMAALALQGASPTQGPEERARLITAFTGSHHFVLDYLLEEVLEQQPESIQTFLLRTSILDRMCGPLCEAVGYRGDARAAHPDIGQETPATPASLRGQETLERLERANLFVVPLDSERHWYRYHHLFGSLLRQRLRQHLSSGQIAELHICASAWYESNGLLFEAFHHAAAANDVERAERLIENKGMGLHYHSVATAILDWLDALPPPALDARPLLRVRSATLALMAGRTNGVEEKLLAAERSLQNAEPDRTTRDLIGQIACARATLAITRYDPQTMRAQALRALEYLPSDNLTFLFTANWALASACLLQGDRAGAAQACREAAAISQANGSVFSRILIAFTLGNLQKLDNQLHQAALTYQRALELSGEHPHPNVGGVHLNLAQIYYEWNDLEAAERQGQLSLQLMRQFDLLVDRFIVSEVFLARLKLARGDLDGAASRLAEIEGAARRQSFTLRLPEIAAEQVLVLIQQGQLSAAARLAGQYELPLSRARVLMARHDPSAALAVLEPLRQQMEARGWADKQLKVMVLQAMALHTQGEENKGMQVLGEALALAEPGGFIRLFVDEGEPMRSLLSDFRRLAEEQVRGQMQPPGGYVDRLLAAFGLPQAMPQSGTPSDAGNPQPAMVEPLSPRELEILRLIAQGLSNREIGERLFLALNTVKGHNRVIFDKLQVQNRTEAIARTLELGLL
jgi:LuxR family transcriptional regulator, maltose regulon positive regulatory protein